MQSVELRQTARRDDDRWFRELIDHLGDMVCRYRVDGTILYANKAYASYFQLDASQIVGRSYLDFVVPEAREAARANTERLARELTPESPLAVTEHATAMVQGQMRWLQWTDRALFDPDGALIGFVSVGRDVTERRAAEDQAHYHARHDVLTGLANRRSILEALEQNVVDASSSGRPLGVLFIDIDGFKAVNDTWGHQAGDEVLRRVATALVDNLRTVDKAGRLGGDEFVALRPRCGGEEDLLSLAQRLESSLAALDPPIRISVGAVLCTGAEDADEVLHRADHAMYAIKTVRKAFGAAPRRRSDQPAA